MIIASDDSVSKTWGQIYAAKAEEIAAYQSSNWSAGQDLAAAIGSGGSLSGVSSAM